MIEENKLRILKRAKKMAKRRYRSEQYRRCFHQFNTLEKVSTEQFDKMVSGEEAKNKVVSINSIQKKIIQPAMPVSTHLHLYKQQLLTANG